MSGPKPAPAKGGSATTQILADLQKALTLIEQMKTGFDNVNDVLNDHTQMLQEMNVKMNSARVAAPKGGRAKGTGGAGSKKEDKKTIPPIHILFRNLWKEDEEGTIEKFCKEDSVEAIRKAAMANPTIKNKKGDNLKSSIAGSYYTRHFAKRTSDAYEAEGHAALKKVHSELQAALDNDSEGGEGDGDDVGADDVGSDLE